MLSVRSREFFRTNASGHSGRGRPYRVQLGVWRALWAHGGEAPENSIR
jgi:hypothetical protein